MSKKSNFILFILSHGRPDNCKTANTLINSNYRGDWIIICDNEDKTINEYVENYGDKIYVFDKIKAARDCDLADNFEDRKCKNIARNKCYDIADELGYEYFLVFDDDYIRFDYKFNDNFQFISSCKIINLYRMFNHFVDYMKQCPSLYSICFAQGGDFFGGPGSQAGKGNTKFKGMNSFFQSTKRRFPYVCRFNDDLTSSILANKIGNLVFTVPHISLLQIETQKASGGLTDVYRAAGTYVKSFYSILAYPSTVKITLMGLSNRRFHHRVNWKTATPKIISEEYRKSRQLPVYD